MGLALAGGLACSPPAWEERYSIGVDGAGEATFRVRPALLEVRQAEPSGGDIAADGPGRLGDLLRTPEVVLLRTGTLRDGRLEAAVRFSTLDALCDVPLLDRQCTFRSQSETEANTLEIRVPERPVASAVPEDARAEIRIRPSARVLAHNSDGGLRRGNQLVWSVAADRFFAEGLEVRLATDGTSVFAYTVRTVMRGALIAGGIVAVGLTLVFLEGRRRLRNEPRGAKRFSPDEAAIRTKNRR